MLDRTLWAEVFQRNGIPRFPCPNCKKGRLLLQPDSLMVVEPEFSKVACRSDDWEPGWEDERFVLVLKCDEGACGEYVTSIGDTTTIDDVGDDGEWYVISVLRPKAMFPAPPLINIEAETPADVAREIRQSFSLFWNDLDAAANRLRVSVERLLDYFSVPYQATGKDGKINRLDLNGRIAVFGKTTPEHTETLTALRMIGNLGSHGSGVVREAFFDALEVYEDCLQDLVGTRKQRLADLKKKLIDAKGKY